MSSDAELLVAWRSGDARAGEVLFKRWLPLLYRFFRHKTQLPIDDLVQDTFLSCIGSRDDIRNAASFRAYLLRVARNRLYSKLRRRDRELDEVGLSSLAELAPSPSAVASANERSALLLEALLHVPLELRLVLELHYWEACSAAEIADILGVPVGTIKTRIRRARQLTRQALERRGATPTEIEASMESVVRGPRDLESLGS